MSDLGGSPRLVLAVQSGLGAGGEAFFQIAWRGVEAAAQRFGWQAELVQLSLAGYVAAGVTQTGTLGTFGGADIPPVTDFMDSFVLGAAYYNQRHGANVAVRGWDAAAHGGLFANDFTQAELGLQLGAELMNDGADIILPVAGAVGLGTAAPAKQR